jgi:hypothetical protein
VISGLLRTAAGTIDLTAVAAAANKHLRPTTDTHAGKGLERFSPRPRLAHLKLDFRRLLDQSGFSPFRMRLKAARRSNRRAPGNVI